MRHNKWILPALILAMAACNSEERSEYVTMDDAGWLYGETIDLRPLEQADTIVTGDILVGLRHTGAYKYRNLWLELTYPMADTTVVDTVNLQVADLYGHWYGSGSGVTFQLRDTVATGVALSGREPIRLRHIMRADTLAEIEQVGLIFIPKK